MKIRRRLKHVQLMTAKIKMYRYDLHRPLLLLCTAGLIVLKTCVWQYEFFLVLWSGVNFIWHAALLWTKLNCLSLIILSWTFHLAFDPKVMTMTSRASCWLEDVFSSGCCSSSCPLHQHHYHHHQHSTVYFYFNSNWTRGTTQLLLLLPNHFESDISKKKYFWKSSPLVQSK